jgi:urease accessory protein
MPYLPGSRIMGMDKKFTETGVWAIGAPLLVCETGVMDVFDVCGNVVLCTPKDKVDRIQERGEADVDLANGMAFGACRLLNDAGLIYKVLGRETVRVKAKIREFWSIVRKEVTGANPSAPFMWRP